MIGIFQGSPKGRANECQRRAWEGNVQKAGQKKGMGGRPPKNRAVWQLWAQPPEIIGVY